MRYARSPGLRLESLGDAWAAFSARSGDTLQLNNEAAAVLEVLAQGPLSLGELAESLAQASETDPALVVARLDELWPQLLSIGFVDEVR
jgi:PqqD family protein of HPr-rel-A system